MQNPTNLEVKMEVDMNVDCTTRDEILPPASDEVNPSTNGEVILKTNEVVPPTNEVVPSEDDKPSTSDIDKVFPSTSEVLPSTSDEVVPSAKDVNGVADKIEHKTDGRKTDSHLVQIQASNAEISRRIAALVEQKQREVDINNRQEFCGLHPSMEEPEYSCARTDSVFVPRAGGISHIKVSRVVNLYGPQTRMLGTGNETSPLKQGIKQEPDSQDGVEERLTNMEAHLRVKGTSRTDVFSRLKCLEEKILFLESLSPEYFTSGIPEPKRVRTESRRRPSGSHGGQEKDLSLSEIDARIQMLRNSLLKKSVPS